jgi:hypothetical protein
MVQSKRSALASAEDKETESKFKQELVFESRKAFTIASYGQEKLRSMTSRNRVARVSRVLADKCLEIGGALVRAHPISGDFGGLRRQVP